jgi:uncharacterized protein involved in exopolysaccharide biosynthesis
VLRRGASVTGAAGARPAGELEKSWRPPLYDPENRNAGATPAHATSAAAPGERAGIAVDPLRILLLLRRGARLVALATVVSAGLGIVVAKTLVKRDYEARAILQWELAGTADDASRDMQTVLDGVKLPANLERVRARLALRTTLEVLGQSVDIVSSTESKVVTLKGKAHDGEQAARITDEMMHAFLDSRIEADQARLNGRVRELGQTVAAAQQAVAGARQEYDEFRRVNGIANLPVETQAAIEQAARLKMEGEIARVEMEAEKARLDMLLGVTKTESQTAVLSETEIMPDAQKLAEAKASLTALKAQLSPDHPRVLALAAQVASLEKRVSEGAPATTAGRTVGRNPQWESARTGVTMATAQRDAALKKQATYAELEAAAQGFVAKLTKIEGEASARLAVLQLAERHRIEVEGELTRAEDAARSPTSGFRVLAAAQVPSLPSKSRRSLVALLSPGLGLVVSLLVVLLRGLRGLRVLTGAELAFWGRAPVVATSSWPRDPAALDDLVADLADAWQSSMGSTLVLGFAETEAAHVKTLVDRLQRLRPRPDGPTASSGPQARALEAGLAPSAVRRTARQASRVLVLVESGRHAAPTVGRLGTRLGRDTGVGLVLVGAGPDLAAQPDRIGDGRAFWGAIPNPAAPGPALVEAPAPRAPPAPPAALPAKPSKAERARVKASGSARRAG